MKIFVVCNSLGTGGAERVGVNLANGFARHRHDVTIITDIYQKSSYPVDDAVKILPLCSKDSSKLGKWLGAISRMRQYAKNEKPDAIIGIMYLCSFVARVAVIGKNTPVVMTIHHALQCIPSYSPGMLTRLEDKYMPRFYKITTVLTQADRDYMGEKYRKVTVMPNPLTFDPIEISELAGKEKCLLAAGRIDDWSYKGWDILIKAWGKIAKKYPEWKLLLAGDGRQDTLDFLKNLAKENGVLDRMEFLGYRTDMLDLYKAASIYVLSSRSEGLPMVLIEAMSQGCAPVAVENLGRTKEIIQDESQGLLCETGSPVALAAGMSRMISDDDYRHKVQKAAIQRSKYYSLDSIIVMWENLLKSICKK